MSQPSPEYFRDASFDELLEAGWCECGRRLADCPGPSPVDTRSWMSQRQSDQPWRNTVTGKVLSRAAAKFANVKDQNLRSSMPHRVRVCARLVCGEPIPATRRPNAKYCSDRCQIIENREVYARRIRRDRIQVA
jgi:predicted nucleic acid-binding Zn ribbon protein